MLWHSRGVVVTTLVAGALIIFPPQSVESAVIIAGDPLSLTTLILLSMAVLNGWVSWASLRVMYPFVIPAEHAQCPRHQEVRRYFPRVMAAAPFAVLMIVFVRAAVLYNLGFAKVAGVFIAILVCSAITVWALIVRRDIADRLERSSREALSSFGHMVRDPGPKWQLAISVGAMFLGLCALAASIAAPDWFAALSTFSVILLAGNVWAIFLCAITALIGPRGPKPLQRKPLFGIVLLAPIAFALGNCNDNHALRPIPQPLQFSPNSVTDSFTEWLRHRPDVDRFTSKEKYPVFLVAAEGGGIYAAAFTSQVLAQLQDANPAFAGHIFAISGVSGGSVGATVFARAVKSASSAGAPGAQPPQIEPLVRATLENDYLSPLVSMLLFADLLQRFLPYPFEFLDRARALEHSIELNWKRACRRASARECPGLEESFYAFHQDFEHGSFPALLLNTTNVEDGGRVVIGPFALIERAFCDPSHQFRRGEARTLFDHMQEFDLALSTAAFASARFPLVTPHAHFTVRGPAPIGITPGQHRIADGGYYENSGVATLGDLASAIREADDPDRRPYQLILITISAYETTASIPTTYANHWFSEISSPLIGMLNTRGAHGRDAQRKLRRLLTLPEHHDTEDRLIEFRLRLTQKGPPLGWQLSADSHDTIHDEVRANVTYNTTISVMPPSSASSATPPVSQSPPNYNINNNDAAFNEIVRLMNP